MVSAGDRPRDDLFALLRRARRRVALGCLLGASAPLRLSTLAERVAAREDGEATVEDVTVELHHVHVPLLRQAGLVAVDGEGVERRVRTVADVRERLRPLRSAFERLEDGEGDDGDGDDGDGEDDDGEASG